MNELVTHKKVQEHKVGSVGQKNVTPCKRRERKIIICPPTPHPSSYPLSHPLCSLGREKAKAKISQKAPGEGQRSKIRLSPALLSGPEVAAPRRNTTGKKQPRRTERSNSVEENQSQTCNRSVQHR